jgi:Arc/MetJ-type ribon-helix-helix transcriptional regulator
MLAGGRHLARARVDPGERLVLDARREYASCDHAHLDTARIAYWYAWRMAQVVTRLDDRLMAEVDELVAEGVVANRSEAVRLGLERLVDEHQRRRVGALIVAAYRRLPQTEDELAGLDDATRALISEEPW